MVTGASECSEMGCQVRRAVAAAAGAVLLLVWPGSRWGEMASCRSFLRIENFGRRTIAEPGAAASRSKGTVRFLPAAVRFLPVRRPGSHW